MPEMPDVQVSVSEFVDLVNETFEFAFPSIVISGELANFRVSKNRWVYFDLKDELVQGESAPAQIAAAIERFNALGTSGGDLPEALVIIRGGGSADDLAAFSHEMVARAVAASRIPTLAAIGHEVDTSLVELAADMRASTPSNAAELLVPDKRSVLAELLQISADLHAAAAEQLADARSQLADISGGLHDAVDDILADRREDLTSKRELLEVLSPQAALKRGYAIIRGADGQAIVPSGTAGRAGPSEVSVRPGAIVRIELLRIELLAQITAVRNRKK
jgi:exodeoxyribonuclease VII large subunit